MLMIFIFLSFHGKTHDNEELSRENSKSCESQIMAHYVEPCQCLRLFAEKDRRVRMFFYSIQHTKVQLTDHNALHPIVFCFFDTS